MEEEREKSSREEGRIWEGQEVESVHSEEERSEMLTKKIYMKIWR